MNLKYYDLLLYPYANASFSPYYRSFYLQEMMINTKNCNWPRCRQQETTECSGPSRTSVLSPSIQDTVIVTEDVVDSQGIDSSEHSKTVAKVGSQ